MARGCTIPRVHRFPRLSTPRAHWRDARDVTLGRVPRRAGSRDGARWAPVSAIADLVPRAPSVRRDATPIRARRTRPRHGSRLLRRLAGTDRKSTTHEQPRSRHLTPPDTDRPCPRRARTRRTNGAPPTVADPAQRRLTIPAAPPTTSPSPRSPSNPPRNTTATRTPPRSAPSVPGIAGARGRGVAVPDEVTARKCAVVRRRSRSGGSRSVRPRSCRPLWTDRGAPRALRSPPAAWVAGGPTTGPFDRADADARTGRARRAADGPRGPTTPPHRRPRPRGGRRRGVESRGPWRAGPGREAEAEDAKDYGAPGGFAPRRTVAADACDEAAPAVDTPFSLTSTPHE